MLKHLFRRTCIAIPTLLIVLTIVFFLMRMIPGSPAEVILGSGDDVTKEDIEALEDALGLNDPLPEQYIRFIGQIATGNWGDSYIHGKPVFERMMARWEPAIFMAIMATAITVVIAFPVGILSATHRNSIGDYITTTSAIAMQSIPTICWSLLLIYFFTYKIPIFRSGYVYIADRGFFKAMISMTLPALSLGLHHVAGQVRYVRTTMLDVMNQDYVRTAKSKGLPQYKVYYKHALKNTLNITGTMVISSFVGMLGGTAVTEKAFSIYGLGTLAVEALSQRDYSQEQAIVIWSSTVSVLMGLFMDCFYYWLDPRIKYE